MRKNYLLLLAVMLLFPAFLRAQETPIAAPITVAVDTSSHYVPTQIVNGDFSTEPWMDYVYNSTTYTKEYATAYPPIINKIANASITYSIPHGVGEGWNTTETRPYASLFEYSANMGAYNPTLNTNGNNAGHGGFVEMNAESSAILYQDLYTYEKDVIRWTLQHAVRTSQGAPSTQSMKVGIGAPERDSDGNIVAASGINNNTNSHIIGDTEAFYTSTGCTGYNGYWDESQNYLTLNTTNHLTQWYDVTGVYSIPEGQTVTRFAFIATQTSKTTLGNLLDNITFSTLIGNLTAIHNTDGTATLKGYWGETDDTKHLEIKIGETVYAVDMSSVEGKNFVITIPAETIGTAEQIDVYHEDYEAAKRTVAVIHTKDITAHKDPKNTSDYYATFFSSLFNYSLPENVKAYTAVLNNEGTKLTLTPLEGSIIPINTAVILKGNPADITPENTTFQLTPTQEAASFSGENCLQGVASTTYIEHSTTGSTYDGKYVYTLGALNNTVGFYKYAGSSLAANKAYFLGAGVTSAPSALPFSFAENTTGVREKVTVFPGEGGDAMKSEKSSTAQWYTLDGRRLSGQPTQKGFYIHNGKKYVIR